MRRVLDRKDLSVDSRIQLHHALGKALEDEKSYPTSFRQYALANELRGKKHTYDREAQLMRSRGQKRFLPRVSFGFGKAWDSTRPDPIFVLGMTRSGSTLVEQILASHSMIEGTKELRAVHGIAQHVGENSGCSENIYPEVVADVPLEEFKRLGEEYMKRAARHRKTQMPFFIDKTPRQFSASGLHSFDFCLKQRSSTFAATLLGAASRISGCIFRLANSFTSNLEHIGLYYRDYVDLMAHFDEVLPGRVHRIFYEDLVSDPREASARRPEVLQSAV